MPAEPLSREQLEAPFQFLFSRRQHHASQAPGGRPRRLRRPRRGRRSHGGRPPSPEHARQRGGCHPRPQRQAGRPRRRRHPHLVSRPRLLWRLPWVLRWLPRLLRRLPWVLRWLPWVLPALLRRLLPALLRRLLPALLLRLLTRAV